MLYEVITPRATFVPIACSVATLALMVGLMALLDLSLNMFTSALPALLWVRNNFV